MSNAKVPSGRRLAPGLVLLATVVAALWVGYRAVSRGTPPARAKDVPPAPAQLAYRPRQPVDTGGFNPIPPGSKAWEDNASLEEVAAGWTRWSRETPSRLDGLLARAAGDSKAAADVNILKVNYLNSIGKAADAYELLERARASLRGDDAERLLYTVIYYQGLTALRRGENDNCVMCRGESSCILPISSEAVHAKTLGSRTAIRHFTEYLDRFPDDLEVRWLLNIAHMTLGEHPGKVDPKYAFSIDPYVKSEFDIGEFRDVAHLAGVNKLNQAGGAIMEDFDGDGLLDLVLTSFDPTQPMTFFRSKGDGTFEDRTESAGLTHQLGGLVCYQADYNNDGKMDIFVARGAWLNQAIRPSLLRNDGGGSFTDVTAEAGMLSPTNSNAAIWADYDNDGFVDLFIANERQAHLLYHNKGDGTFEEVAGPAGPAGTGDTFTKGATWIDYDNDGAPDLYLNNLRGSGQLFRNEGGGKFGEVTIPMEIVGPTTGFSCWAWDYDNDGWLDIFATCYDGNLAGVVSGLMGRPHNSPFGRLYRNVRGERFEDVTVEAGLDKVYSTMGSNFGDFDNDGFLDFYLSTGGPSLATLTPNRMLKNVGGKRFAEITGTSRTGHLQKGHGVAIGDWDRDGDVDLFLEMGGAINGDKYHDILFQNPGQGNHWLTVKLVGEKSNRAAIGARITAVTEGDGAMTIHRLVSSGSSFGANPLQQTIGVGKASRVATLEVYWPTSKTTQVFRGIPVDQSIEVTEFAEGYRRLDATPIPQPR